MAVSAACAKQLAELPAPPELYAAIVEAVEMPEMIEVPEEIIGDYYGIEPSWYGSIVAYKSQDIMRPDEIVIARATSKEAADRIREKLEAWLAYKEKSAANYFSDTLHIIRDGIVRQDALTVSLLVTSDITAATAVYSVASHVLAPVSDSTAPAEPESTFEPNKNEFPSQGASAEPGNANEAEKAEPDSEASPLWPATPSQSQTPPLTSSQSPLPSSSPTPTPPPSPSQSQSPTPSPSATPAPSQPPAPSPSPSQSPTPSPSQPPRTVTAAEVDGFFDDAVFVGDSITEGLAQYVLAQRKKEPTLGNAKFLTGINGMRLADCAGDMGSETMYFMYKGTAKTASQCISEMGVSKVFIMLGANDLGAGYGINETIDRYSRAIDIILEAAPYVEIYIELNTPRNASSWLPSYVPNKDFGNRLIDEFNDAVRSMCEGRGLAYIDLNAALKGENGALPEEFCRDGFDHINNAGAAAAVEALRKFAKEVLRLQ